LILNAAGKFETCLDFQLPPNSPIWVTTAFSAKPSFDQKAGHHGLAGSTTAQSGSSDSAARRSNTRTRERCNRGGDTLRENRLREIRRSGSTGGRTVGPQGVALSPAPAFSWQ
jgi:hypothetical protein